MIQTVSINPPERAYTKLTISGKAGPLAGFPLLSIDRDSYVVQAEVQSGINFRLKAGCHCIAIGRGCSLADGITLMIDLNHDYRSVSQGSPHFLQGVSCADRIARKGTIIIQNDVWVGHGAMIMAGVTLHNGCIVAAGAVVTKDVPPYAIVGGNPARILRYRFDADVIEALQKIAWWDWPEELQKARREDFTLPVEAFAKKYLPAGDNISDSAPSLWTDEKKPVVLFPVDIGDPFPLYSKILDSYFKKDRPQTELLLYLPEERSSEDNIRRLESVLEQYEARDCFVTLQTGITLDERLLFQGADYYVTTRSRETVRRTCLADLWGVMVLYGTDDPVFPPELQ